MQVQVAAAVALRSAAVLLARQVLPVRNLLEVLGLVVMGVGPRQVAAAAAAGITAAAAAATATVEVVAPLILVAFQEERPRRAIKTALAKSS